MLSIKQFYHINNYISTKYQPRFKIPNIKDANIYYTYFYSTTVFPLKYIFEFIFFKEVVIKF